MRTFNGFGTTLYGHSEKHEDGSFISTEWLVFAWIPIYPVESYRVTVLEKDSGLLESSAKLNTIKVPLYKKHVVKYYLVTLAFIAFFVFIFYLQQPHKITFLHGTPEELKSK